MSNRVSKRPKIALCLVGAFLLQSACSVNRYRKPVSDFQLAAAVVSANARTALTELNRLQRVSTIREHRREKLPIRISDILNSQLISDADLQVRLDALDRLNEYVDLLVRIANSDAPNAIANSATELTTAIGNLTSRVNTAGQSNFKNAFGVAGVVLSEILRFVAQRKIKEALDKAILQGEVPINALINAIGDDLEVAFLTRKAGLEKLRTEIFEDYNREVVKTPPNERMLDDLTSKMIAHEETMDTLIDANPRASLRAMANAHSKIVLYARSKSPVTLGEALESIEIFAATAKRLGDAVLKLKSQTS